MTAKTPKVDDKVTRTLATYAANTRFAQLPANAVAAAKLAVLNIIAAALGGAQTRIGALHTTLAREIGGGVNNPPSSATARACRAPSRRMQTAVSLLRSTTKTSANMSFTPDQSSSLRPWHLPKRSTVAAKTF